MYDHPDRRQYMFPNFDFGGGADGSHFIRGPAGKYGRLYDYGVQEIAEVFNGDTTDPVMSVGTASDADAYGEEFDLTTARTTVDTGATVRSVFHKLADIQTYVLPTAEITPADYKTGALVKVTLTAATGANLTGQALPVVVIDWQR